MFFELVSWLVQAGSKNGVAEKPPVAKATPPVVASSPAPAGNVGSWPEMVVCQSKLPLGVWNSSDDWSLCTCFVNVVHVNSGVYD